MKNFFSNIMKTLFGNTINDLYGSEEKPNKPAISMGILFSIAAILLSVLYHLINADKIISICLVYFVFLSFSISLFAFSSYFFQKKKNMRKFKKLKSFAFVFSLILISIAFFPTTLLYIISEKIKFTTFLKHMDICCITLFVPLVISLLIVPYTLSFAYKHCSFLSTLSLNYMTILSLLIFIACQGLTSLFLYAFHKIGKTKLNNTEYKSIKKDFNVLVFAEITTITVIANCFVFPDIEKEFINGFTSAFAIYIAFDRLVGKWKTLNKQFEQDSEQANP